MSGEPQLSVVVPVLNEERTLPEFGRRLTAALEALGLPYEVIVVNDGSRDGSLQVLKAIHGSDPRWRIIDLSRNFGHGSACTAGLKHARGRGVVVMDADLQDPPELIGEFVKKWKEGWQVVYGARIKRSESRIRQLVVKAFYRLLTTLSDTPIPEDVGIFSLIDRAAVDQLTAFPEWHRYLTGLRAWVGFRQVGVPYERQERWGSMPSQTWVKLARLAADALFSFSILPLRLATMLGVALALGSFAMGADILYEKLFTNKPIIGWTSTMLAIIMIGGMILVTLGVIGEYVGRIYDEIKQRPLYIIQEKIGF